MPIEPLKIEYDNLGDLTKWNLAQVSGMVIDRENLENVDVKKVGGTVGKIVKNIETKTHWLLKKSGRTQVDYRYAFQPNA